MLFRSSDNINGSGNELVNRLTGNAGNNVLDGGLAADIMKGGLGNDTYVVREAGDIVTELAGQGTDQINSFITKTLDTNVENLLLLGSDNISGTGNALSNSITGNTGDNWLNGGLGSDTLIGMAGKDSFNLSTALGAGNIDTIVGFSVVDDVIRIDDAVFTQAGAVGVLAAAAFHIGAAAADASDRIIYNSATGRFFYDADGTGVTAAVQFAILPTGLAVTNADFVVI